MTETNVFQLSQPGSLNDPLTEVLRDGARALLAQAIEAEVATLLSRYADESTDDGHRRLVRHGHLPEREIMTGIGPHPWAAHGDRANAGHDLALRQMSMAHQPLAAILGRLVGIPAEQGCDFGLDSLRQ